MRAHLYPEKCALQAKNNDHVWAWRGRASALAPQESMSDGQEKVYKDVIEPLESISLNIVPTQRKALTDIGGPEEAPPLPLLPAYQAMPPTAIFHVLYPSSSLPGAVWIRGRPQSAVLHARAAQRLRYRR